MLPHLEFESTFAFCEAACRTTSSSTVHENAFISDRRFSAPTADGRQWHYASTDPSDWTMTWSGSLPVENRSRLAEVRDTLEHRSTRFTMRFISP